LKTCLGARLCGTDRYEAAKGAQCILKGHGHADHQSSPGEAEQHMCCDDAESGVAFGNGSHDLAGMAGNWGM